MNEDSKLEEVKYLNEHIGRKKRKDNRIEMEYTDEIELTDPETGKITIHKVKVTRYKSAAEKQIGLKGISEELGNDELNYDWNFEDENQD